MTRGARLAGWAGIGILAGIVLALVVVMLITRTQWGMERARGFALGWLEDRVEGELRIGRITGESLLGGLTLHDFAIDDPTGRPFVRADSAVIAYNWRTLVSGDIVLNEVTLYGAEAYIEKMPGDTAWNYEYIFPDTAPGQSTPGRNLILFQDAAIRDGTVVLRMPFDPDETIQPGDTARVVYEQVPTGLLRVMRFDDIEAELERVIWESPIEPGRLIEVAALSARGQVYREPLTITSARGRITVRDSVVAFEMPRVEMPSTRAALVGRVIMGERNDIDMRIDAEQFRFSDLQWLYANLPEEGGGSGVIRIQTQQPKGILVLAREASIFAPGTRLAGTFGMVMGDTTYFTQVDLRASPLNVQLVEDMLPGTLPIDGLLVGTVEVQGPLSALEVDGDVRLQGGSSAGSNVQLRGTFDATRNFAARNVRADVRDFDLGIVERIRPGTGLQGRVEGRIDARAGPGGTYAFTADLAHRLPAQPVSRFRGSGTTGRGGAFDITLDAVPMSLDELAAYYPVLDGLRGHATGAVRASGTTRNMTVHADLTTDAGPLLIDAALQRDGGVARYTGYAETAGLQLDSLYRGAPASTMAGRLDFDLAGLEPRLLAGPVTLRLDSVRTGDASLTGEFGTLLLRAAGHVEDGRLHVDSTQLGSTAIALDANGSIGLFDDRTGTLTLRARSSSLAPLEAQLFETLPEPGDDPRIDGAIDLVATVTGAVSAFDLGVEGTWRGLSYQQHRLARGSIAVDAQALGTPDARWTLDVSGDSVALFDIRLDSLRGGLTHALGSTRVHVQARGTEDALALAGRLDHAADSTTAVIDSLVLGVERDEWRLERAAHATLAGGRVRIDPFRLARADTLGFFEAGGTLDWGLREGRAMPLDFALLLDGMPLRDVLRFAGVSYLDDGVLGAQARLTGTTAAPRLHAQIEGVNVGLNEARLQRVEGTIDYADALLDVDMRALHDGRATLIAAGQVPIDLRLLDVERRSVDRPLEFQLRADSFPLAVALGVVDGFDNVSGSIHGELTASGRAGETVLGGGMRVHGGAMTWTPVGVRYRDVAGTFEVMQDRIFFVDVGARGADPGARVGVLGAPAGTAHITGRIDFAQPSDPRLDLRMLAHDLLAANRRDVVLTASGDTYLRGSYRAPVVSATLTVEGGTLNIDEIYRQYLVVGLDSPLLFDVVDTSLVAVRRVLPRSQNVFLRNLAVRDTRVSVGAGSWLRSREMNVEVTGDLGVVLDRRAEDLRLTGTLEAVRGTYDLNYPPFARRFAVREGTVEFPGTPGIDPNLSITAAYQARTTRGDPLDIYAQLTGSLHAPRVRLYSDQQPPISESDLASYLFLGVPTGDLNITAGSDVGMSALGIGRSALAPSVLGSVASGLQTLAQRFGIVDYVGLTAADNTNLGATQSPFGGLFGGANLEIGRYLGPDLFVAYTQRIGGNNFDPGVRLEWSFSDTFTAEVFAEDRFARQPGFGLTQTASFRKVYGFSLFREWSY